MAEDTPKKISNKEDTKVFTFEVTMIIQLLGADESKAREQLDAQGGYVTSRTVELVHKTDLYNGATKTEA